MFMEADAISDAWLLDGFKFQDARANGSLNLDKSGGGLYLISRIGDLDPIIKNCTFTNNKSSNFGGGIYIISEVNTSTRIEKCTFYSNFARNGGGLYLYSRNDSSQISSCFFTNNNASDQGGGLYTLSFNNFGYRLVTNSVFANNYAGNTGGGFQNEIIFGTSRLNIKNCSFANNIGFREGGGIYSENTILKISNSIIWGNTAIDKGPDIYTSGSGSAINYSIIVKDSIYGEINYDPITNIQIDPLFVDPIADNLHLKPYSPAINTGFNDSIPSTIHKDINDNVRIIDTTVDIGAYEYLEGDCPHHPILDNSYSPLNGIYAAKTAITIKGIIEINNEGNVTLNAPIINVSPTPNISEIFTSEKMGLLEIQTDGCD